MSEEVENANDGTLSGLKKTIIGVVTTAVMGLGTWGVTQITGGDEAPAPAAAPVINITNSNQQSQAAGGGKTVIIKEKETVKEVTPKPAPVKKKEGDEFKEEAPKW
jgi:secreted protein with Ig-like and vWFA domain